MIKSYEEIISCHLSFRKNHTLKEAFKPSSLTNLDILFVEILIKLQ